MKNKKISLENKNLLVIAPFFSPFIKDQVNELKNHFKNVYIIISIPYFPKILSKIPFIASNYKQFLNLKDFQYDNVKIFFRKYYTLPLNFFRKIRGNSAYKVTKQCIKKNKIKFELIHAHFTWPSGYVAIKLKKDYNKKSVLTVHENRNWFLEEYRENNPKKILVWKNSDLIIRVNKKDVPLLKKYNKNTINIPNGFDDSKFKKINYNLKDKLNIPKNKKILLNVASYKINHKNQINLIKAIKELLKVRTNFILYLIGSGKDEYKIKAEINHLKLNNYIKVLGPKPHKEIPLWMNASDIFILPSYSEGNPTVMFEALGCGLPYVGTDVGGVGEIITSKDYGLIYKNPKDYKQLAGLINESLNKKWNIKKILNYAKKFTWEIIAKEIIKQYKKELLK